MWLYQKNSNWILVNNKSQLKPVSKRLTFRSGCSFCAELNGHPEPWHRHFIPEAPFSRILYETPKWVVVPTIGPLVTGHILIVSRDHADSILATTKEEIIELEFVLIECVTKLSRLYKSPCALFEHGTDSALPNLSGACIDHAHLHVLPCKEDFAAYVRGEFQNWLSDAPLHALHDRGLMGSYLLVGSTLEKPRFWFHKCSEPTPSQCLRMFGARLIGTKGSWNWRDNPNGPDFIQTISDWNK